MMFLFKSILSLLIIISIVFSSISVVSSSNLYSITSNTNSPFSNQILNIIDPSNPNSQPQTININIDYQIISIVSINTDTNTLILLCSFNENGDKSVLVQYSISTNKAIELASISTTSLYGFTQESVSFSDKSAYLVVSGTENNFINIVSLNFADETSKLIQVQANGFKQGQSVVQGFDYTNNILYLGYMSSNNVNVVSVNVTAQNPNSTVSHYYNIQGVDALQISMIFVDNSSNFYLLAPNSAIPNYYSGCKVENQGSNNYGCVNVLNVMVGSDSSVYTPYNGFIVSSDHQSLVFLAPNQYVPTSMFFTTVGINNDFSLVTSTIPNVWSNYQYPIWVSIAY